jgi:arsenite oxidase small subunit
LGDYEITLNREDYVMQRRTFVKLCAGTAAVLAADPGRLLAQASEMKPYQRVKLVNGSGEALSLKKLDKAVSYIFSYPYKGTPCVLLNLGKAQQGGTELKTSQGQSYTWPGGVGPDQSVVAYVSICTHQLAYPNKSQSFMNFQKEKGAVSGKAGMITCCLHNSVFDPSAGGKVTMGGALQPLPTIKLDYDPKEDAVYATGVLGGGELFENFFTAFKKELRQEFGRGGAEEEVSGSATVVPLSDYTAQQITC